MNATPARSAREPTSDDASCHSARERSAAQNAMYGWITHATS